MSITDRGKEMDTKENMKTNTLSANGTVRSVYFSLGTTPAINDPKFDCAKAIVDLFDQAKNTVHVAIYSLTEPNIVDAIIRANNRGVNVEIITDAIQSKNATQAYMIRKLTQSGVNVRVATRQKSLMHNKVAIFDSQTICTGSFNWSINAEENNDENLLVVDGHDLANDYEEYVFQRILKNETLSINEYNLLCITDN
jgi:phosphatidylserine/phosphatidylglycerophosphate/cardiolipin synthase-like enzyme